MKDVLRRNWLLLLVLAMPLVYLAAVWPDIPKRVPIHFNAAFTPDGWMNKPWGPLLMPLTSVFVTLLVMVWFRFDPKMVKTDADTREHVGRVLRRCLTAVACLLGAVSITIIHAAWGNLEAIKHVMGYGIPLLFLVMGNELGKLRPNYTIGIRVPWTLACPAIWRKTHRLGGRLMVVLGLVLLTVHVCGAGSTLNLFLYLGGLLAWSAIVIGYAIILSRKAHANA